MMGQGTPLHIRTTTETTTETGPRIDTRFADSRAADLSLAYGLRPLPALGTHSVTLAGLTLELRVLGASHQVVLTGLMPNRLYYYRVVSCSGAGCRQSGSTC